MPAHPDHKPPFFVALLVATFVLWLCPLRAQADVYTFVAEDGVTHYSDRPDDSRFQLLLRQMPDGASDTPQIVVPDGLAATYAGDITDAARNHHVEAALLHAVIAVESQYNPRAVSPKGALGMMQLMPTTARAMGVSDPMNASQNIRGGAKYLRMLLDRFANNKSLALAAYNAGPAAVLSHGGRIPPFAETRFYVPQVLRRYNALVQQSTSNDAE
ncbi:lytic transglycosylase domain-containing protein [Rhodoferax sp. GW822-FHT02A01]|uniref:lytic transglycosylase domain-containing protein n=1 Tax=Rhodoferax sp. GW822-FHT02A01 TaxID=3141537 RepID=UPI00315CACFD